MFRNYLIANIRNLWKNRSHTFVNLAGLTLGITSTLLIFLILRFELSFDNYHPDTKQLYRVVTEYSGDGSFGYSAGIPYQLVPNLRNDFAELEHVVIVDANHSDPVVKIERQGGTVDKFKEPRMMFTDEDYFRMFKYEFVEGNENALAKPHTVVLVESLAKKYFGNETAIGKTLTMNGELNLTVTGVVKDPPLNTDLPFRIMVSMKGNENRAWGDWTATSTSLNCYVKLKPGNSKEAFDAKLKTWHLKYFVGDEADDAKNQRFMLQPMADIHFDTRFNNFSSRVVSMNTIITLGAIGLFLLVTACINFINLNTVLIINRAKEAGIRKVMGSSRRQLVLQFLGETLVITVVALLFSTGLAELGVIQLPLLGYQLSFEPTSDVITLLFTIAIPLIVTVLAGLYPALRLSSFQPIEAIKTRLNSQGQGVTLRRALIVFQLVISQGLIVCTIIVVQQLRHFSNQPLGLNSHAVIEFELPENKPEVIHKLRDRISAVDGVENFTMSNTGTASGNAWGGDFEATVNNKIIEENANAKFADEHYIATYGLKLLHGENLVSSDTVTRFVVNERFARVLGFDDPKDVIGTPVNMWGARAVVTGVVKDFNTRSLHSSVPPTIIMSRTTAYYVGAARIDTRRTRETIAEIKRTWEEIYPEYVFEYAFLDDTIASFYEREERSAYLIGIFAIVAIIIGSIGLFGMVSFMAKRKTKEVGIRKTMGASVSQVMALFSKEFIVLIAISFLISAPVAYLVMDEWLQNFVYRIQPGFFTFLVGIFVTFVIVLSTVGFKSYRAAIANPVNALRDE